MNCPKDRQPLETVNVGGLRIDRCPTCGGTWYDRDELRVLKNREAGGDYRWIDLDLWKNIDKFRAREQQRYQCPKDGRQMTTVHYDQTTIAVDVCSQCKGMWLDKEEYQEIIDYLERTVDSSSASDYLKDVRQEMVGVLEGHENPVSAVKDVGKILYLLELRFIVDHPMFAGLSQSFPKF